MNVPTIYLSIAKFLSISPKWVENWFKDPIKVKYINNPLNLPEIISNILKYLTLNDLEQCNKINRTWKNEVFYELHKRYKLLDNEYEKITEKYHEADKEFITYTNGLFNGTDKKCVELHTKFYKLGIKKYTVWSEFISIVKCIKNLNLENEFKSEPIDYYIYLNENNLEPDSIDGLLDDEDNYY